MDVTPLVPRGRQLINGYGDGGFRISGVRHEGSVWLLPESTLPWPVSQLSDIDSDALQELIALAAQQVGILLIGTGRQMLPLPKLLRHSCQQAGIAVEPMDTGAACRTYNVLLTEERAVAAALIAV
jgi:uncharacterized protein